MTDDTDEFTEALASIENARGEATPVQLTQEKYAPLREKALALLEECEEQRLRLEPLFREATDKYNRAYLAGVSVPSLKQTLHEAWKSLEDAPKSATAAIQRIDTLTQYNLAQGTHLYFPRMVEMCRDHMEQLERLAEAVRSQLSELRERVKIEARRVAPATAIHVPERNGVVVESTFDPRVE
jgi:hypothetical protein